MSNTDGYVIDDPTGPVLPESAHTIIGVLIGVNALVLGLFIVLWPQATLTVAAVLFGLQLVIAGIFRIVTAFIGGSTPGWQRALLVVIGILLLIFGIACLKNPQLSIATLVILIGLGWLIDGIIQIAVGVHSAPGSRTLPIVVGVISIIAAIILLVAPVSVLLTLLHLGGWLLIIIGALTLIALLVVKLRGRGSKTTTPATA